MAGHPIIATNINRDHDHAGFTFPYGGAWGAWEGLRGSMRVQAGSARAARTPATGAWSSPPSTTIITTSHQPPACMMQLTTTCCTARASSSRWRTRTACGRGRAVCVHVRACAHSRGRAVPGALPAARVPRGHAGLPSSPLRPRAQRAPRTMPLVPAPRHHPPQVPAPHGRAARGVARQHERPPHQRHRARQHCRHRALPPAHAERRVP